jgi:hypothetical protein
MAKYMVLRSHDIWAVFFTNRRPWLISPSVFHSLNKYNHACQIYLCWKVQNNLITLLTFYTTHIRVIVLWYGPKRNIIYIFPFLINKQFLFIKCVKILLGNLLNLQLFFQAFNRMTTNFRQFIKCLKTPVILQNV